MSDEYWGRLLMNSMIMPKAEGDHEQHIDGKHGYDKSGKCGKYLLLGGNKIS